MENIPSQRVLEKSGFRKGRVFTSYYVRAVNVATGKRSDLQSFYMMRPGTEFVDWDDLDSTDPHWKVPSKEVVSQDDILQIRKTLSNDGIERINKAL